MAIALLAGSNGHFAAQGGSGGTSGAGSIDTTGASGLFLATNYLAPASGGTAPTVSDNKGNTWFAVVTPINGAVEGVALYYAFNANVGSGHTFSSLATSSYASLAVIAVSGMKTSTPVDATNFNVGGGGTTLSTQIVSPAEDNEILVTGLAAYEASSAFAIDSGFTISDQLPIIGGVSFEIALAYQIQTTKTNRNPNWSWSPAGYAATIIGTFKAAAAAAAAARSYGAVIG